MKKIFILIILSLLLIFACDLYDPSTVDSILESTFRDNPLDSNFWEKRASYGNDDWGVTDGPVTFCIDDKYYVGLGTDWVSVETAFSWVYTETAYDFKKLSVYDPDTDSWSLCAEYPGDNSRNGFATVYNNEAYVAFTEHYDSDLEETIYPVEFWKYTPSTDTWTELASLPDGTKLYSDFHTAYNGKLYTSNYTTVYIYDVVLDSWSSETHSYYNSPQGNNSFISSIESEYVYSISTLDENYEEITITDDGETYTIYDYDNFYYSISSYSLVSDSSSTTLYSSIYSDYYPAFYEDTWWADETVTYNTYTGCATFLIDDYIYLCSNQRTGTFMVRLPADGSGAPETLDWPEDFQTDSLNYNTTYPIVGEDRLFVLDEDCNFYMYKP